MKATKNIPTTLKVGEGGGDLLSKEGLAVPTCCNSQLVFCQGCLKIINKIKGSTLCNFVIINENTKASDC